MGQDGAHHRGGHLFKTPSYVYLNETQIQWKGKAAVYAEIPSVLRFDWQR